MTPHLGALFKIPVGSSTFLRRPLQHMWSVADPLAKRLIVVSLVLVLGSSIIAATTPLFLRVVIDALSRDQTQTILLGPVYLVVVYTLAHWLSRSLGEFRELFLGRADQRVHRQLSNKLFQHVMSLPLRFHLDRKTGALSQTLTTGLLGYRILLYHLVNSILPVLVEFATMGAILIYLGHSIFVLIIGTSILAYTVAFWVGAVRVRGPAQDVSTAHIDAGAVFTDSILNFETVKYFNAESQVQGRFIAALRKTEHRWAELYIRKMENGLVVASIFTLTLGFSLYFAASSVQQGSMTVGDFVLVNAYVLQLTRPLELIGFAFRDIVQGVAFIEKMSNLLDEKREVDLANDCTALAFSSGELIFDNVSFAYDTDRHVLRNVCFAVPAGKTLAIVGASGSGKSSLTRLLTRLVDPISGQIYVDGVPVSSIPVTMLRDAISVVPQDIVLFNDSVAYNIAFGKHDSTQDEIVNAAKVAGLHNFILGLPDGYDTKVGERGLRLSGGEKQRVAIARAAIKRPRVFVFDEATSSLDSKTERTILGNLIKVAAETTSLIIAHRLSTVIHADEIVVLDEGSVVERGTHDSLMKQSGVYAAMWRAQNEEIDQSQNAAATCI